MFILLSATVDYAADLSPRQRFKVLVVMSYEPDYEFTQKIRQGIDSVLSDTCRVKYFYMKTKNDLTDGPQKAKAAFNLYKNFGPMV